MNILQDSRAKLIVKMKFGSHLYGTDTPESDTDIKGVFLPSKADVYLGRIQKSVNNNAKKQVGEKNMVGDIDLEMYSLHYFLKLACEGQTVAIDMLHAPTEMLLETTPLWDAIVNNREKFYTKNLNAFVGYARKQAAKYGVKGSRLEIVRTVINILSNVSSVDCKLSVIWDNLVVGEYSYFIEPDKQGVKQYKICGKILQETMSVQYAIDILQHYLKTYGQRAKLAAKNEGIDWKVISHALRAAYQVK